MKKIAFDLIEYARGASDFGPNRNLDDDWQYPLDLEFTLRDEERHFTPKDAAGLPIKRYRSVGDQYNPTRMAAFAFAHWDRVRSTKNEQSKAHFLNAANWFAQTAKSGRWYYRFDWSGLHAPWISCMSQGEAISVLTRAYLLTEDPQFLEIAQQALEPFRLDIERGGVRSRLPDGSRFWEEYPLSRPAHVLNGYLYALIGLNDLNRLAPTPEVSFWLSDARSVLETNLHLWDQNGWSTYDLHNLGTGSRNLCTANYHRLHATQLRHLGKVLGSSILLEWSANWEKSGLSLQKRIRAAAGKIAYRVRHPAQR